MSSTLDVASMEKDGRLLAIRKLRTKLFRIQFVVAFVFSFLLLFTSGGFQLTPLYVPLESFVYFLLVMGLLFSVQTFVFNYLEMTLSRSQTAKHFMVRKAQKRTAGKALLSVAVLALLISPTVIGVAEGFMSSEEEAVTVYAFYNKDVLGVSVVESITISSSENVEVYIITEQVYTNIQLTKTQLQANKLNTLFQVGPADGEVEIALPPYQRENMYVIIMADESFTVADLALNTKVDPYMTTYIPVFALIYALGYVGYAAWLTPKRIRFNREAMYS